MTHWLSEGVAHRPRCSRLHPDGLPCYWPHLLEAIYQACCNLFHGEKSVTSDVDGTLVDWSVDLLLPFLKNAGYLEWQSKRR